MSLKTTYVGIFLFLLISPSLWADPLADFKLDAPVIDQADMLSPGMEVKISDLLFKLKQSGGSQIAVVTLASLEGDTIEAVSIKLAEKWALGTAKEDNGVLLLIAKAERKMRIEVGQGLEGDLPDAYAKRIIDQVISPEFRQGEFGRGVFLGVVAIISKTDPQFNVSEINSTSLSKKRQSHYHEMSAFDIFVVFLVLGGFGLLIFLAFLAHSGRSRYRRSGYFDVGDSIGSGGYGGGGGFSDGGGFGGGGGGFSGGGASGGW